MPALVAPLVGFALGVALAWLADAEAARDGDEGTLARAAIAALYGVLAFAPACGYFLIFAPDWSFAYFVDSRSVPSAALLVLAMLDAAVVPLGFLAGRHTARRRAERALAALAAAPLLIALAAVLALFNRLRIEGTFHQVKSDFGTQPVAGGPLGYAILWMGAMIAGGFVVALGAMTRRARIAPTRPGWARDDAPGSTVVDEPLSDGAEPDAPRPAGERRYLGTRGQPGERRGSGR